MNINVIALSMSYIFHESLNHYKCFKLHDYSQNEMHHMDEYDQPSYVKHYNIRWRINGTHRRRNGGHICSKLKNCGQGCIIKHIISHNISVNIREYSVISECTGRVIVVYNYLHNELSDNEYILLVLQI